MLTAKKKPFKVNLRQMQALCEANYARMLQLFPNYETDNLREFSLGEARVAIEVIERCRYTTIFRVCQQNSEARWLGNLRMELRAYHDAGMLEVGSFQSHARMQVRYQYPNSQMHQQDEKAQQNRFLADWLRHCVHNGLSPVAFSALPGGN